MAAVHHSSGTHATSPDTLITIKISVNDVAKRLKLPLRDLGVNVLPDKLRQILDIKPHQHVVLERYSDSSSGYITLDENNPQVFKTLIRAAKAKLKLRLKATVTPSTTAEEEETVEGSAAEIPAASSSSHISSRDSTALDQRSIGSGIFQFREARASQQTLVNDEAPVPRVFMADPSSSFPSFASQPELAFRSRAPIESGNNFGHAWSVYCNECDKSMADAHYHCSICDGGDYDLCEDCVSQGKLCPGEGHWLIKRFIKDGKVIHSTTERISPRPRAEPVTQEPVPGAFMAESKTLAEPVSTRTCNNCVIVLPEREFVTCSACEDFDLCLRCHAADKHGHHPGHGFERATEETVVTLAAESKLAPGRNIRHNAICDGCDKKIYGIRHKCLNCPDWDFCSECVKNADHTHRHHRFAALYEPIADIRPTVVRHYGIYCDGPLCNNKADQHYIQGVRYKCAICHDTDFCAACEALPNNPHNRTHPLIKFKTPVRNVNVSTENEDIRGNVRVMGDYRPSPGSKQAPQIPLVATRAPPANAATQVHTVAEIKPTEIKKDEAVPIPAKSFTEPPFAPAPFLTDLLNAHFVRDSVPDGMSVEPEARFVQVWTMKNPGPSTWPAGCSVRYVGGDNMLNVDNRHPASVTAIAEATESNVVGRPVNVGEEVAFKVVLKAPTREGKSISYWRLKAPDGTPFGHRLWCDVVVQKAVPALVESAPQPPPYDSVGLAAQVAAMRAQQAALAQLQRKQYEALSSKAVGKMNEEQRRAAFQQRMAQLRADVVKIRGADSQPNVPDLQAKMSQATISDIQAKMTAFARSRQEKKTDEGEKVRKIIAEVSRDAGDEAEAKAAVEPESDHEEETEQLEGSQMVFPKLEKESPASSTYESIHSSSTKGKAAYVENEDGEVERSASPAPAPAPVPASPIVLDIDELDEDIEVLSAHDDESEDDGFMTDEEYDILDASDQETVASLK